MGRVRQRQGSNGDIFKRNIGQTEEKHKEKQTNIGDERNRRDRREMRKDRDR